MCVVLYRSVVVPRLDVTFWLVVGSAAKKLAKMEAKKKEMEEKAKRKVCLLSWLHVLCEGAGFPFPD
jgi:hypothetical protein